MRCNLPSELRALLASRGYLLCDGAMGTRLMEAGLGEGALPERWNITHSDRVQAIHRSYVEAGCDIILTNSFGGNAPRLAMHAAQDELRSVNMASVRCARAAVEGSGKRVFIAGSMGPTGALLLPYGQTSEREMEQFYYTQGEALREGGVDMLWIETQIDIREARAAMRAARSIGLPYSVTMTFDTAGKTMMGVSPEEVIGYFMDEDFMGELSPWGVGLNCGLGSSDTLFSLKRMGEVLSRVGSLFMLIVKGNCGVPVYRGGQFVYDGTEEILGRYACLARDLGAVVIGACCGSGDGHVRRMAACLADSVRGGVPSDGEIELGVGRAVHRLGREVGGLPATEARAPYVRGRRRGRRARE